MEYDTNKIQFAEDDVASMRKNYGEIANELSKAEAVLDSECPGDIANKFKNDVFYPARRELDSQLEKIKKLEDLLGKLADDFSDLDSKIIARMNNI